MYRFIETNKTTYRITVMCDVLGVSRSGYYDWSDRQPSARQRDDQRLTDLIDKIHAKSRECYGSPRIHAGLIDDHDESVGVIRVARLMADAGDSLPPLSIMHGLRTIRSCLTSWFRIVRSSR